MGRTILVPLDGTRGSEGVLASAAELARAEGGAIRLLHVAPPVQAVTVDDRVVAYADEEEGRVSHEMGAYFRTLATALPDVPVEMAVRFGDPVEEILKEAASGAGLIAMATHRRSGFRRLVAGSVAERVERAAKVPVLLVAYGEPQAA